MHKNNMYQNRVPESPQIEKCNNTKSHFDTISSSKQNSDEYGIQPAKEIPSPAYIIKKQ
ncbi:MAG: hypothetical protein QXU32_13275 [Nitrososphaerales archaeon]